MSALDVSAPTTPGDRSDQTVQRLVVAWQHPTDRSIEPIGFLSYDGEVYRFGYIRNALSVKDFRPLLGFADIRRTYHSEDLFPMFAQRAMDPRRPDYRRYIERLGLEGEHPGPWEQIARSQGRRQGDTIQLLPEPKVSYGELAYLFLVNGVRHVHEEPRILNGRRVSVTSDQVENALAGLRPGDALNLAPEPRNPTNPLALMVIGSSTPVGWVPNLLVEDMRRLQERSELNVTVERVNGTGAPPHLRLLARLHASCGDDFEFFTGARWLPVRNDGPAPR